MKSDVLFFIGFVILVMMLIISYWETISLIIKTNRQMVRHIPEKKSIELIKESKKQAKALDEKLRIKEEEPMDMDALFKKLIKERLYNEKALNIAVEAIIRGEIKDTVEINLNSNAYQSLLHKIHNTEFSIDNIEEQIASLLKELKELKKVKK